MSADQQSPTDKVTPLAQTTNPLERGEPTGIPELMAVAGLTGPQPSSCTATLVGERVILTAAHCVFPFGSGCAGSFEADPYVLGTAHAVLARFEQGALLGAPLVDHFGYQFVTAKGREGLRSERITSLGQRPGLVVDLSRCL